MNTLAVRMIEAESEVETPECPVALAESLPGDRFRVMVANNARLRQRAWQLAYEIYHSIGYEPERESRMRIILQDALPETVTFLVEARPGEESPMATLTLVPDSPMGIPMDANCGEELKALRRAGRRFCEVAKLAVARSAERERGPAMRGLDATMLLPLFQLAWLQASSLQAATDLVISVTPHHARFYQRVLMFEPIGRARTYGSVNGTTGVPLRLDLTTAEARYAARYGSRSGARNLYRQFVNDARAGLLRWLAAAPAPMSEEELRYFFVERSDCLVGATEGERFHLRRCYPKFDLDRVFPADRRPRN